MRSSSSWCRSNSVVTSVLGLSNVASWLRGSRPRQTATCRGAAPAASGLHGAARTAQTMSHNVAARNMRSVRQQVKSHVVMSCELLGQMVCTLRNMQHQLGSGQMHSMVAVQEPCRCPSTQPCQGTKMSAAATRNSLSKPASPSPCPGVDRPAAGAVCGQPVPEYQSIVLQHGQHHRGVLLDGCNMQGCGAQRYHQPPAQHRNEDEAT